MSSLSQRLHLGVQQKQILTPGLVQMVTVLQLNRLELKDMIMNEIAENPVLEEAADAGEELTPAELQSLLEREARADPADAAILESTGKREQECALEPTRRGQYPRSGPDGVADGAHHGIRMQPKSRNRSVRRDRFRQFF